MILDLQALKLLKLSDGKTIADSLSVHALRPKIKAMGIEVGPDAGKQDMLLALDAHYRAKETSGRKLHPGEALISHVRGQSMGAA